MKRFLMVLALALSSASVADDASKDLYQVQDGTKVDAKTLMGWKTWRALACERCHGAQQEGLVGPSLIDSLKTLSKEDFHTTIMKGRHHSSRGISSQLSGRTARKKTAKVTVGKSTSAEA